jgi:hypothetical protein
MRECWLCGRIEDTNRHFDLYVYGSEGIVFCHQCEMMLVNHIRELKSISTRAILIREKRRKGVSND